jgi:acetyl-CoA/propionyl-CoA carboxylase biotin carboxyl carrier protein
VLPFHRAVLDDPAFTAADGVFDVHTRWIETEFVNTIEPFAAPTTEATAEPAEPAGPLREFVAEVNGRRVKVGLPSDLVNAVGSGSVRGGAPSRPRRARAGHAASAASGGSVVAPMQGTVVKVADAVGDPVSSGDVVAVVEAMKMENPITAHRDGVITAVAVEVGGTVTAGAAIAEIGDAE